MKKAPKKHKETVSVTRREMSEILRKTHGKFFGVKFTKRTTGEARDMVARTGVVKHLKGGKRAYNFDEKNLLPVFDMQKYAYRCIPLDGVDKLVFKNKIFICKSEKGGQRK
ncbi:MAG: hypothetical protein DRP74_07595 [Candidatus Omnitrophota bacterium]|nr:MAG: hypothetical protein DRP74_07595 [Candidatus Omnitrophota bacterium]